MVSALAKLKVLLLELLHLLHIFQWLLRRWPDRCLLTDDDFLQLLVVALLDQELVSGIIVLSLSVVDRVEIMSWPSLWHLLVPVIFVLSLATSGLTIIIIPCVGHDVPLVLGS